MLGKYLKKINSTAYVFFLTSMLGTSCAVGADSEIELNHKKPTINVEGSLTLDKEQIQGSREGALEHISERYNSSYGRQDMSKSTKQTIQDLLSRKFDSFGERLNDQIQTISEGTPFKELTATDVKEYLTSSSQGSINENKEDVSEVTIFITKKKEAEADTGLDDEECRRAILGAAYFPEELDPATNTSSLVSLSKFEFIHRQLADARAYGHPLAQKYLDDIMAICNVPSHDDSFRAFCCILDPDLSNYDRYVIPVTLPPFDQDAENTNKKDLYKRIEFAPYSKEVLNYFKKLIDSKQHPEERRGNKRRKLEG